MSTASGTVKLIRKASGSSKLGEVRVAKVKAQMRRVKPLRAAKVIDLNRYRATRVRRTAILSATGTATATGEVACAGSPVRSARS